MWVFKRRPKCPLGGGPWILSSSLAITHLHPLLSASSSCFKDDQSPPLLGNFKSLENKRREDTRLIILLTN